MTWAAVAVLAVGTWALKGVGPVAAGGRRLPARSAVVLGLLPPALLAALVALQTVTDGATLSLDARLPAVLAAGVAVWRGAPFIVVVAVGTATAAGLRLLGMA